MTRRLFETNAHRLPPMGNGQGRRLLEIGCAAGSYLREMAGAGWEVHGLESNPEAAAAAGSGGYPVLASRLETAPDPAEPFDLIVGWHVFEHLHEPLLCLEKLRRWLRPGGWLVLSMPNAASYEFRLFRDAWYATQLPVHLYHYTPRTLAQVLAHASWRLERVLCHRSLNNLPRSLGLLLQDHGRVSPWSRALLEFPRRWHPAVVESLFPLAWLLGLFGQTGRMTIWARRQEDP
jgi:SAM-dependent methyltransferase